VRALRSPRSRQAAARGRRTAVLLQRLPAGPHPGARVGVRPVLPHRGPAGRSARPGEGDGPLVRRLRRRAGAGRGDRSGWARASQDAAVSRGRALRRLRLARREASRRPERGGRGPPERRHRRRRGHLAAGSHAPLGHRPRARSPRLHAARPPRLPRPGGAAGGGPGRPRTGWRRLRLRDEPDVPARRDLRRRTLGHGQPLRDLPALAFVRRRPAGHPLLGAPVLPDGRGGPQGGDGPHRPAHRGRADGGVRRKRGEHGPGQRCTLVRFARDAGGGPPRRPAAAACQPALGARAGRQPARRGLPGVRATPRGRPPRRTGRRGPARGSRAGRPGRDPIGRAGPG